MFNLNLNFNKKKVINDVEVLVEKDSSLNYEIDNFFNRFYDSLIIIFLKLTPHFLIEFLINKTSKKARKVKEKATTYYALDRLYAGNKLSFKRGFLRGFVDYFWFNLRNPRAVRNRLKLVKKILEEIIIKKIERKQNKFINFLSLGCGSARAIVGVIYRNKKINPNILDIKLLDKEEEALKYSQKLILKNQLGKYHFSFILDKINNFDRYLNSDHLDIIEMVGVLDYLSDEKAIEIFKKFIVIFHQEDF